MKTPMKKLLMIGAAAIAPFFAHAETWTTNNVTYTYTVSDGVASISKSDDNVFIFGGNAIEIPATVGEEQYPVTSIGDESFTYCLGLASVAIPDSVTSIGHHAFLYCTDLTRVTIGNSVTNIGEFAFLYCNSLTSATIGRSVTSIGTGVFFNCGNLTNVTMSGNAPSVGIAAFYGINSDAVVHLPRFARYEDDVDENGKWQDMTVEWYGPEIAIDENGALTHVIDLHGATEIFIPNGVTSIGDDAFYECTSLTSVTIPDSVTSIGEFAFAWCENLTDITIPDSVTSIGRYAFWGCEALTAITIPDGVTSIGESTFSECGCLTSVTMPDSVTSIGGEAFHNCRQLTNVTIPDSVTSIGVSAFYGCVGLADADGFVVVRDVLYFYGGWAQSVTIPDSVTSIDEYAFINNILTSVTIPDSVTSIGNYAFPFCMNLTSVTMMGDAPSVGMDAFDMINSAAVVYLSRQASGYTLDGNGKWQGMTVEWYGPEFTIDENGVLTSVDLHDATEIVIPDGVTSIGERAFNFISSLTSVTIPNSVTNIGENAFYGCIDLTSVTIPDSVTSIGGDAFGNCGGLTCVTIGNGVTSIGRNAFEWCIDLKSLTIGHGVTCIEELVFYRCTSLTSVTIPASVTRLGSGAFHNCTNLTSVTMMGDAPYVPTIAFDSIGEGAVVYLPRGASGYKLDASGKWQKMTVVWYGAAVMVNGEEASFVDSGDGRTRTATVADGTAVDDIKILVDGVDVSKGYSRKVEGTTATIALLNPYEVQREGAADAPWTEDGGGNVTLNVEVVPGLYYAAASAASLDALKCPGASAPATDETTLVVAKPERETQGFYKVWVSDRAIEAE